MSASRVSGECMDRDQPPFVLRPIGRGVPLVSWAHEHESVWKPLLLRHGGLLFRDFETSGQDEFRRFIEATSSGWAIYREPSTPRVAVGGNLFTSTEYPPDQAIPLHNENSHCGSWPLKIYFYCVTPSATGGQTPIADCRRVLSSLPAHVVDTFVARRWKYVRHFGGMLGFAWQKVFGTDDRADVERYCRENVMDSTWESDGTLTISYVRDAVRVHPATGERVWFNHGLFFNPMSLAPEVRDFFLTEVGEGGLPYNTFYGDGGRVPDEALMAIRSAYDSHTRQFTWQTGDLLMLDNMLMAHGRRPFTGSRRILAGLADPYSMVPAEARASA
jgi:alpha-ketoglutarate-dependent taurine dioxygenase